MTCCCLCESYERIRDLRRPARAPGVEAVLPAGAPVCGDCVGGLDPLTAGPRVAAPRAPTPRRTPRAGSLAELLEQGLIRRGGVPALASGGMW